MKRLTCSIFILSIFCSLLIAQDYGAWIAYDLEYDLPGQRYKAVGGNCLLFAPQDSNFVLAFDTYSHQWHRHELAHNQQWSDIYAGENSVMIWSDSLLILYDAINQEFEELRFEGEIQVNKLNGLPGATRTLSYVVTTEKLYVYEHLTKLWIEYAYVKPGSGDNYAYTGTGKSDYVLFVVTDHSSSDAKLIAYSASRKLFEEINSVNLQWKVLDHGFACWVNQGLPDEDLFFTAYSAANGFMDVVRPDNYFDVHSVTSADHFADHTTTLFSWFVPSASNPGGTRYIYAADTRNSNFNDYYFDDIYGGSPGVTLHGVMANYSLGLIVVIDAETRQLSGRYYDGDTDSFHDFITPLSNAQGEVGFSLGSRFIAGYDPYNLMFYNLTTQEIHTSDLPDPTQGYQNHAYTMPNTFWGIGRCERALTDTVRLYSLNSLTDNTQIIVNDSYSYDGEDMEKVYYWYVSQAYGNPYEIFVYLPNQDLWVSLPLAVDVQWGFRKDFIYTYDKTDGNMKVFDAVNNAHWQFPFGWQYQPNFSTYTYSRDNFLIAYDDAGKYHGYSSFTTDISEIEIERHASQTGQVAIVIFSNGGPDILAYNAFSNSFIPLQLSEEHGDSREIVAGDSTALLLTAHGHLLAFDPWLEAVGIIDKDGSKVYSPAEFKLYQNFPNPFNPQTTINYHIGKKTKVELSVYNLLGQKIASLVDQSQDRGIYSIDFDGSALASGVYFYRLQTSSGIFKTKKLVLLK